VILWSSSCSSSWILQEEAVRDYGILNCGGNDGVVNQNLLVIAPTSSGKTFIGEMAAVAQVIHHKKSIFLVPSRALAEEKYRHFKNLYRGCGLEIALFSRDRKEDDYRINKGDYKLAVMSCEKFIYFFFKYPEFLNDISLLVVDEAQMINNPKWGPLLEDTIDRLAKKELINLRIIALSALIENQEVLLKWFPARPLISYQYPVEIRKGILREGVFKYITSKEKENYKREVFFVRYLVNHNEPTLIFFANSEETRKWAKRLASQLESPPASSAIEELKGMEETLSQEELLELLEKGVAYYNRDLSWEETNLVETYLRRGEIKVVCATATLATGINLPFKNIIVLLDKMHNYDENYLPNYRTGLSFIDIENISGSAGILNIESMGEKQNPVQGGQDFGRVIFLAYSLLSETIFQNVYFNCSHNNNQNHKGSIKYPLKKENDLLTFLLRLLVKHGCRQKKIKKYLRGEDRLSGYWRFSFNKENIDEETDNCLKILKENKLIRGIKGGILSPTANGILIITKKIKVETYLFLKNWIEYSKKGEISDLKILLLLAFSADGRALSIPSSPSYINDDKKGSYNRSCSCRGNYRNKLLPLVFEQGKEVGTPEDYLAFKKTHLLYDWIKGSKDIKTMEQEYGLYGGGAIYRLGGGFSWLADSLAEIAESEGWKRDREKDLNKIKILSKRLIEGVEEEGLSLARMCIPGLSRYYIRKLVGAGYSDEESLKGASEGELGEVLPSKPTFVTILEIDQHRPDRIIFEGEEIKVTATEFSLIYLLAQHRGKILTHNDLLDTIWKENKYATYPQITYHLYKIRRDILKTIGNNKKNKEKVKDILKVVSRRGIMLNLAKDKLKII
jgi:helicase